MLSGFGGDEFVTNSGVCARIELLRAKRYRLLMSRFRGNAEAAVLRMLKWVRSFYRSNNTF